MSVAWHEPTRQYPHLIHSISEICLFGFAFLTALDSGLGEKKCPKTYQIKSFEFGFGPFKPFAARKVNTERSKHQRTFVELPQSEVFLFSPTKFFLTRSSTLLSRESHFSGLTARRRKLFSRFIFKDFSSLFTLPADCSQRRAVTCCRPDSKGNEKKRLCSLVRCQNDDERLNTVQILGQVPRAVDVCTIGRKF